MKNNIGKRVLKTVTITFYFTPDLHRNNFIYFLKHYTSQKEARRLKDKASTV